MLGLCGVALYTQRQVQMQILLRVLQQRLNAVAFEQDHVVTSVHNGNHAVAPQPRVAYCCHPINMHAV